MTKQKFSHRLWIMPAIALFSLMLFGCNGNGNLSSSSDAAQKVYVAPGELDEFYGFMSGGYNGQLGVYGLPSGRHIFTIPVFSQAAVNGYGYSEETKAMLNTSHGFVPWGDAHHPELSQTNGETDGRWIFINENNTPRIARIGLDEFKTQEIIEIPNSAGNHASSFVTPNTEYVSAATRFSIPIDEDMSNMDVAIDSYEDTFKGTISFIKVSDEGKMNIDFQILMPGFDYDLSHAGKGPSDGWAFFTSYNSEQAHTLLEINASKNDKDFIAAVNWKKAAEYVKEGKGKMMPGKHVRNYIDHEEGGIAKSETIEEVRVLDPRELEGIVYFLPTPKSPHGVDIDPSGKYIIAGGKLSTVIPVHSFAKMSSAIESEDYEGEVMGIPVLKYDSILHGEVENPGLGPLHTEFDDKGFAYTTAFISSEIVKWDVENTQVVDRIDTYYSPGHLMIPGGDSQKPDGKYLVALNKITKDRYLPTGPEMFHSAQLIDISGDKMQLLLDFPTEGEPHYAQGILAEKVMKRQKRFYKLEENTHPQRATSEAQTRVERDGNEVHVYMTTIRSHFSPDNIEGIKVGDKVYFHVTNLEQDWDVPHGFAMKGANNAELLIMPGETLTLTWEPKEAGVFPFYCTDFCSALHQEMQGYVRVSPKNADVPLSYGTGK
ncbi:Sec-dependent nitrous-oxide reductase [Gracilimonas mengyeensis]|uniref:Nitrous oxide reductase apoprotein n=1 Tax=Gracilimonas mengyeensis TaxID=1302730 RepID=A0A521F1C7_9BACT|nr:Sec-dependent nitrous-oxide reductase [Gracilimonas mengyeensis]SMO89963.1 nitrous oxide reductase apoprotein [Gracilimonas mengyeensis]